MIDGKLLRNEAIASGLLYQIIFRNQVEAYDFSIEQDGEQDFAGYLADDLLPSLDGFRKVSHAYHIRLLTVAI